MPILRDTLENLKKGRVKELNLVPYKMEVDDLKTIIELLPLNHALKTILLGNSQFERGITENFAAAILKHGPLVELVITGSEGIGDAGARVFADMLAANKTLAALQLSKCNISDVGARALVRALKSNRSLNILDLSNNKIGDGSALVLAEVLKENKTLTRLRLDNNQIGSHGLKAMAEALAGNRTLVEFTVANNKGDDKVMQSVERAFEKSSNIINLKTNSNRIIPVCNTNKETAIAMFNRLTQSEVADLPRDEVEKIKDHIYALVYVAENDLRVPRHRILDMMKRVQKYLAYDVA